MTWVDRYYHRAKTLQNTIHETLLDDSSINDPDLIRKLRGLNDSEIIYWGLYAPKSIFLSSEFHKMFNIKYPPILCWGWESLMVRELLKFKEFYNSLTSKAKEMGIKISKAWLSFPKENKIIPPGKHRFSPERLKEWVANNPGLKPGEIISGDINCNSNPNQACVCIEP